MIRSLVALSLAAAALTASAEPRAVAQAELAPELRPVLAKAEKAMDVFQGRLLKRLNVLLRQGGPIAGIQVCPTEAPRIAKEIHEVYGVEVGRTSHRVRNPANAPRAWAASHVAASAGKKAAEVKPVIVDLGDRLGVLRPIAAMPTCSRCHGEPDAFDPDVKAELAKRYPQDQGTGFAPGDLRGFTWAEVKKP